MYEHLAKIFLILKFGIIYCERYNDVTTEVMSRIMNKLNTEPDDLTLSLFSNWQKSDLDEINYSFMNKYSYDQINKIILNINQLKNAQNENIFDYLIDILLNRSEPWQEKYDANSTCEWCVASLRLNEIDPAEHEFNLSSIFNQSNSRLTQQNLIQIQNLFSMLKLPRMAYKIFLSNIEFKNYFYKSIKIQQRKVFLMNKEPKFSTLKIWKTSDGILRSNLINFEIDNVKNSLDLYPNLVILYYPTELSDQIEWVDINEKIVSLELEQTEGNIYYKGLRLVNHFKYVRVKSVQECFNKCIENEECAAVTYRPINKDGCHFYRKNDFSVVHDPEWVSASYDNLFNYLKKS